jgi:hypothetical protein
VVGVRKPVLLLASVALAVLLVSGVAQAVTEGAVLDAHVFYTPNEVTPFDSEPGGIPGPLSQPFVAQNTGRLTDVQVMVARDAGSCGIRVKVVEFVPASSDYQVLSEGTLPAKATDGGASVAVARRSHLH